MNRRKPEPLRVEALEQRIVLGYYSADSTTPLPLSATCDCMTPQPTVQTDLRSGGGTATTTQAPVRNFDGSPVIVAHDLASASAPSGFAWGLTRTWGGINNSGPVGNGWAVGEIPQIVVGGGTNGTDQPGGTIGNGVASGTANDDRLTVVRRGDEYL